MDTALTFQINKWKIMQISFQLITIATFCLSINKIKLKYIKVQGCEFKNMNIFVTWRIDGFNKI